MSYADIPSKRIESHSRTCATVVTELLKKTLLNGDAADRALSAHLKANHQLGSRDRRIISETLFSVLRWWGWLKHIAPPFFTSAADKKLQLDIELPLEDWFPCLAAAWLLEGRPELPPSASWWLHKSDARAWELPQLPPDSEIQERRKYFRPFFAKDSELPAMPLEALLPSWCEDKISCPFQLRDLTEWMQARPPVWLRAQTNDLDRLTAEFSSENIRLQRHPLMKHALKASFAGVNLRQLPSFLAGKFEIQDAASQSIALICAPNPGEQWWDCCAGAGGKTLHLAWLMNGKGKILATDNRLYKLEELKLRARRCQRSNIICKEWLGIDVKRYNGLFKGVLVDAPCSCSGTWRRNPGARWTSSEKDLEALTALQKQLLANASNAVAPGGTLVYATCSMFRCENQDIVEDFLAAHPDFSLAPFTSPVNGEETCGMQQIWPWDSDCDAMFAAKFIRNNKEK